MSEEQKGGSADRQELHTTSEHQTEHKIEKQETPGGDKKTQKPYAKNSIGNLRKRYYLQQ